MIEKAFGQSPIKKLLRSDVAALRSAGDLAHHSAGELLFRAGDSSDCCYLVVRGAVELARGSGGRPRVVARLEPGRVAGDIAMLLFVPYHSTARTLEASVTLVLDRRRVVKVLETHPNLVLGWLSAALGELRETHTHVAHLLSPTIKERLAEVLVAQAAGGREVFISQADLAALLGVRRQSINRALGELAGEGLIETGYRSITLRKLARLKRVARATH
jgi:CRP-like cAMP-binding protein